MSEEKKDVATTKTTAKKVYNLADIKANPNNKLMNILATLGLIGLIVALVDNKDSFVQYIGFEFGILWLIGFVLGFIPVVNILVLPYYLVELVVWVFGLIKVLNNERFDIPVISDWALKAMAQFK